MNTEKSRLLRVIITLFTLSLSSSILVNSILFDDEINDIYVFLYNNNGKIYKLKNQNFEMLHDTDYNFTSYANSDTKRILSLYNSTYILESYDNWKSYNRVETKIMGNDIKYITDIKFYNYVWYCLDSNNNLLNSTDGINWNVIYSSFVIDYTNYNNQLILLLPDKIMYLDGTDILVTLLNQYYKINNYDDVIYLTGVNKTLIYHNNTDIDLLDDNIMSCDNGICLTGKSTYYHNLVKKENKKLENKTNIIYVDYSWVIGGNDNYILKFDNLFNLTFSKNLTEYNKFISL